MRKKWLFWTWCDAIDLASLQLLSSHYYRQRPFPCSVSSLGLTALFKALDTSAYAKMSMATRNLTWATGKRKASIGPHTLHQAHPTFKSVYRMDPDNIKYADRYINKKESKNLNYGFIKRASFDLINKQFEKSIDLIIMIYKIFTCL